MPNGPCHCNHIVDSLCINALHLLMHLHESNKTEILKVQAFQDCTRVQ